jgi:glycine cleavage system H protein
MYPTDRQYTRDHEWVRADAGEASVGITDFAQRQLGDVVFVELPEIGRQVRQGEVFGTIESVKAVSELFSPVSGEIVAVNDGLGLHPEGINATPYETWIVRIRPAGSDGDAALLDAATYGDLVR